MEKKNYGWCAHVEAFGFFTLSGGTVLRISQPKEVLIRWLSDSECFICCQMCHDKSFGSLIELRKRTTKFVDEEKQIGDSSSPVSTRVGSDTLPWPNDKGISQIPHETN